MPISHIEYELNNGFIDHWLVTGPQQIMVDSATVDITDELTDAVKRQVAQQHLTPEHNIHKKPVEQGPLTEGIAQISSYEGVWSYVACGDDHFVHRSSVCESAAFTQAWAYTQLQARVEQDVNLIVTALGPVNVWINKNAVFQDDAFSGKIPQSRSFPVHLRKGKNEIWVRFANVSKWNLPLVMAVKVDPEPEKVVIRIPTMARAPERRSEIEPVMMAAYTERDVFGWGETVRMKWPDDMPNESATTVRLQTVDRRIYGETEASGKPGEEIAYAQASQLRDGRYQYYLMPRPWEMYDRHVRITHSIPVWIAATLRPSQTPFGDINHRKSELILYASRFLHDYFGEVARMLMGNWGSVELKPLLNEVALAAEQKQGSIVRLASLLGVYLRLSANPNFPAEFKSAIEQAVQNYRPDASPDWAIESRQILFYACAVLAGQLYPEHVFPGDITGQQLREDAEHRAANWLAERGKAGFTDWDSPEGLSETVLALALLIDHAENDSLFELASVLLDKILLSIALNSYKGTFGSAHRRANDITVRSGLIEETSGISRLMWGLGIYNIHLAAPIALAMLQNYEFPPIIGQIAASDDELWNRERHAGSPEVNKVTYRTKDYMLCSAQSYNPGQIGDQEHIWQATLGPNAAVFVNHPAYSSDEPGLQPGFWTGNRSLPRVAQWKDVLIAIYNLPADDWMGFTHAYFPEANFESSVIKDGWAFAKVGGGYLALKAANGLSKITQGIRAFRELRSYGTENAWICHMGSAAQDGDFAAFQEKILNMPVSIDGLSVTMETLRGDRLSFAWEGPFLVNDQEQALSGFPHYENPYCTAPFPCSEIEIRTADYLLRLDFGELE